MKGDMGVNKCVWGGGGGSSIGENRRKTWNGKRQGSLDKEKKR